ncbi:MAG: tRNA (cytidine(34)-2'-O)-methyltransferase [Alphaproteobacteria bacterium]|nr:tRNA (cytidine(34)-2'-O)-methyltransferase [Alphaproteobacteria bacterium]
MRLALYQPDIPQNTGTIIRLAACFGVALDVIEPCGFVFSDAKLRRAGLDYANRAVVQRHVSWGRFRENHMAGRLVLLTTRAEQSICEFAFRSDDILMLGSESAGVPREVHQVVEARAKVPMAEGERSLNVAVCAGIVLWEALRQTRICASKD